MRFRPVIDLHEGKVKQIVGDTLGVPGRSGAPGAPVEHFVSARGADWYARLYREKGLPGGHVIQLGPGNREQAKAALAAWPGGLQVGGGVDASNAKEWIDAGASHVIVTSHIIHDGAINPERIAGLVRAVGRERLVIDLSCRKRDGRYWLASDGWRTTTGIRVDEALLDSLAGECAEFLVHAVDAEGRQAGADETLLALLGDWAEIPVTYAGGIATIADLEAARRLGNGAVDVSVGSALDLFGGPLPFEKVLDWFKDL
jgi:phosphoribosylformimino-5-aminoimidazole carboxamide ribotide isomerase